MLEAGLAPRHPPLTLAAHLGLFWGGQGFYHLPLPGDFQGKQAFQGQEATLDACLLFCPVAGTRAPVRWSSSPLLLGGTMGPWSNPASRPPRRGR